jgi:hypothetical protein
MSMEIWQLCDHEYSHLGGCSDHDGSRGYIASYLRHFVREYDPLPSSIALTVYGRGKVR